MLALADTTWAMLGLAAVLYVATSICIARRMAASGRSMTKWFFITLGLTAVPAVIVLCRRSAGPHPPLPPEPPRRCRHCGALLVEDPDLASPNGRECRAETCPSCGMKTDEEQYA